VEGIAIMTTETEKPPREIATPDALNSVKPLMDALGCRWSNHYFPLTNPEAKWCMVDTKTGRAGRVGMTESQAVQEVIYQAAGRIGRLEVDVASAAEHARAILEIASAIRGKS
jgi:hypothetical protein